MLVLTHVKGSMRSRQPDLPLVSTENAPSLRNMLLCKIRLENIFLSVVERIKLFGVDLQTNWFGFGRTSPSFGH